MVKVLDIMSAKVSSDSCAYRLNILNPNTGKPTVVEATLDGLSSKQDPLAMAEGDIYVVIVDKQIKGLEFNGVKLEKMLY